MASGDVEVLEQFSAELDAAYVRNETDLHVLTSRYARYTRDNEELTPAEVVWEDITEYLATLRGRYDLVLKTAFFNLYGYNLTTALASVSTEFVEAEYRAGIIADLDERNGEYLAALLVTTDAALRQEMYSQAVTNAAFIAVNQNGYASQGVIEARDKKTKGALPISVVSKLSPEALESYIWDTQRDSKVRALHASLQGQVYVYGEPTGAESGGAPGVPYGCRCRPRTIIQ